MPLQFNRVTRIATLPEADGRTITIQSIYDQFVDFQDEPENMNLPQTITAGGKDDLGTGEFTVVTATLLDGWRLAFEAAPGPTQVLGTVTGGNFVARFTTTTPNDTVQFPIAPTAFISGFIAQATTGALVPGSGISASDVWDYSGPYVAGSIGEFVTRKLLTMVKFLQATK